MPEIRRGRMEARVFADARRVAVRGRLEDMTKLLIEHGHWFSLEFHWASGSGGGLLSDLTGWWLFSTGGSWLQGDDQSKAALRPFLIDQVTC
ncbi:hypothetical protein QIW53_07275 [Pseudomonas fluorescens]|uniref:hypothetical protein n=1 Tax=Pseudomonas fluorescens TaxID=294 RepID=UPI003525230E